MITPNLNDGETFVKGRSEETARKLFEAAEEAGIDSSKISTASHGYVVPRELADKVEGLEVSQYDDQPAIATEPGTTTNPKEAWNGEAWKQEQDAIQAENEKGEQRVAAEAPEDSGVKAEEKPEEHPENQGADAGAFDPSEHTVEEVKEYLASADDKERDRVIAAEEASEKPRRGILKLADEDEEGDK